MTFVRRILQFFGLSHRSPRLFDRTFAPVDHPLRPELDKRYLDMRAAMASGRRESIEALLHDHFISVDVLGKETTADAMIDSVRALKIDRSQRSVVTTIVQIEESDGIARVHQHYSMSTSETVAAHMPKRLQTLSEDVWVKENGEWKIAKTATLEFEVVDGQGRHRYLAAQHESSSSKRFPLFVTARIWEYIEPMARGKRYEDPLEAFLIRNGIGELDGGGTQLGDTPGIEYVDVNVWLQDSDEALQLAAEELGRLGAPVGSELQFKRNGHHTLKTFGTTECIGIFLDGVNLPNKIYKASDVNKTLKNLTNAVAGCDLGAFRSHWRGNRETALFFYGTEADAMKAAMMPVLLSDPLCQNARVVVRFGRHPNGSSEERIPLQA